VILAGTFHLRRNLNASCHSGAISGAFLLRNAAWLYTGARLAMTPAQVSYNQEEAMPESGEAVKEALAIEAEAVEGIGAAVAEQQQGRPELAAGLLLDAINKERDSLQLLEQGVDTMRTAIEDRRRALDQQEELLSQLIASLTNADEVIE
jgi:hypothetical protein